MGIGTGPGLTGAPAATRPSRAQSFLDDRRPPTPCLVIDLEVVEQRYLELREALGEATVHYAVKACPEPEVLALLARLGSSFDAASRAEIDQCLAAGIPAARVSFGNTIKKQADIAYAFECGVRLFTFDSEGDVRKIAEAAPEATVVCRIGVDGDGAQWPLSNKFGCHSEMAIDLLVLAAELGLDAAGVSFHVGSQQCDPARWGSALAGAAAVFAAVRERGPVLRLVNLGGGFPAQYSDAIPALDAYADAIRAGLREAFGDDPPQLLCEPGRSIAGDAGVLRTEVVLVSRKSYADDHRWVYLDVGRFGGLAESEGEAIRYRLETERDGPTGPVILAGPTCDSVDVLYERNRYELPLDLEPGDRIDIVATGAYTATYASVGFNGFPPLTTYCIEDRGTRPDPDQRQRPAPRMRVGLALPAALDPAPLRHGLPEADGDGLRGPSLRDPRHPRGRCALRARDRHAGEPRGAPGTASGPGRPAHRPRVEHRLRRDRPVVPRPRRPLPQHVGRAVGPLRRGRDAHASGPHALRPPHGAARAHRPLGRGRARRRSSSTAPTPGS